MKKTDTHYVLENVKWLSCLYNESSTKYENMKHENDNQMYTWNPKLILNPAYVQPNQVHYIRLGMEEQVTITPPKNAEVYPKKRK